LDDLRCNLLTIATVPPIPKSSRNLSGGLAQIIKDNYLPSSESKLVEAADPSHWRFGSSIDRIVSNKKQHWRAPFTGAGSSPTFICLFH
jgi:hypothetical protein